MTDTSPQPDEDFEENLRHVLSVDPDELDEELEEPEQPE